MHRENSVGTLGVEPYELEQNINKVGRTVIIFIVGTLLCVSGVQQSFLILNCCLTYITNCEILLMGFNFCGFSV